MDRGADGAATREAGGGILAEVPGGADLARHFGRIPDFDGAEVLRLVLCHGGNGTLRVQGRVPGGVGDGGAPVPERHAAVSFLLTGIVDLHLDGFEPLGRIGGLVLRRAPDRPERRWRHGSAPGDVEIELMPRHGLGPEWRIRARSVEIALEPGEPGPRHVPADGDAWLPPMVGRVLRRAWDPLAVGPGAGGVYDRYVPELAALARDEAASEEAIVAHLARVEAGTMGLTLPPAGRVLAARALLGLRDARRPGAGEPVEQWSSPDGALCVRIVATRDGLYAHEQRALRHGGKGDGRRSWWEDVAPGRSGLFETAAAAEREARHRVGWLGRGAAAPDGDGA